jgi:hypothetical protein
VLRDWYAFARQVQSIVDEVLTEIPATAGLPASYIPELAQVDPNVFAVSIMTVDGQVVRCGDRVRVRVSLMRSSAQISFGDSHAQFPIRTRGVVAFALAVTLFRAESCVTPILYSFNLAQLGSARVHE